MNLSDVSNFLQGSNTLPHYWSFFGPVEYLLDGNGQGISGVDNTFIVFDRNENALLVEH